MVDEQQASHNKKYFDQSSMYAADLMFVNEATKEYHRHYPKTFVSKKIVPPVAGFSALYMTTAPKKNNDKYGDNRTWPEEIYPNTQTTPKKNFTTTYREDYGNNWSSNKKHISEKTTPIKSPIVYNKQSPTPINFTTPAKNNSPKDLTFF